MLFSALSVESGAVRRKGEAMNIRKAVDYSAMFAALEAAMYPELFSQIGSLKDNGELHS